jgi:protein TonB
MGYQALLFCPDEKTARTVTQVLSELDFAVVPCTEPFAAVKKLMGEHFDAVVVDCDNEQNATLLFKSARNAPNNQSALAVAVVEGQAGVAKAFRIGANLVLTKPINVEQAKGTLRVARGLLRKNESAKPATTSTSATAKPVTSAPVPAPGKPVLVPSVASTRPASAVSLPAAPSAPPQKPEPQPSFAASASSATPESGESAESTKSAVAEVASPKAVPAAVSKPTPEIEITSSKKETSVQSSAGLSIVASAGAAVAAAPAREAPASVAAQDKPSTVVAEPETPVAKDAVGAVDLVSSTVEASALPAPSFTFGGSIESGTKSAGGGSKKALVAVAAVVLIAAGGYVAWTQFAHSSGAATTSAPVAARPVSTAPVPQAAPSTAVTTPESAPVSAAPASAAAAIPTSTVAEHTGSTKTHAQTTASAGNAQTHPSKTKPAVDSSKAAVADVAENKAPATAAVSEPIVVKKGTAGTAPGKSSPTSDAPAPSITGIASTSNGGTLPNLLGNQSSAPAPVLQVMNVSQGVSQGLVIKKIAPSYPANALRMRVEGSVQLLATISKKGDISAVKILSGEPSLARAAADAVKQWKYKPYLLDGSPVEIQTQVTVNFKLPR